MATQSLNDVFDGLIFEAETQRFLTNVPSDRMTAGSTKDNLAKLSGTGEVRDTEGRAKRIVSRELMNNLGLDPEDGHTNWIERDFIVARVLKSESSRQNNIRGNERLTYPTFDIYGAVTINPEDDNNEDVLSRKYQVVDKWSGGSTEKPIFYAIRIGEKPWLNGQSSTGIAKQEQVQFASETYSNPKDEGTAFNDYRMYSKIEDERKNTETWRNYVRDTSSVGFDLIGQNNRFGIITNGRSNFNTTSRNIFQATRHLTVDDIKRFVTRKGASNALANRFQYRFNDKTICSLLSIMQKVGNKLAEGTFNGTIRAEHDWNIFRKRMSDAQNPGVDNEYFYEAERGKNANERNNADITSPYGGKDWTTFLSDIASTARGFSNAESIFAGLDDQTLFGLYAKYCIPVKLNRIYFAKKAAGDSVIAGHTMSFNDVQNTTSTLKAKEFFEMVKIVSKPGAYKMPDGCYMFVASIENSAFKFPDQILEDGKWKTIKSGQVSMDVKLVTGFIIRYVGVAKSGIAPKNIHETFFRIPICKTSKDDQEFIFMRYGRGDMGPADGLGSCKSPETMGQGLMMTLTEPLRDISFVSPEMNDDYQRLLVGQLNIDDSTFKRISVPKDPDKFYITAKDFKDMFGREPLMPIKDKNGKKIYGGEIKEFNASRQSPSDIERAANKFAEQDDDEYDPILNDPEEYKRFIDSLPDSELRPTSGGDGSLIFRPMDGTDDFDDSFDEDPYRNDQAD